MSVHDTLRTAILKQRCVVMLAERKRRNVCPHALGFKDKRPKVLVYQYSGDSASGLGSDGAWRCFFLDDIWWAEITDGPWHSSRAYVFKVEVSFDYIECQVKSSAHNGI